MPTIDNFSAWIQVDNQPLLEYQVEYSGGGTQVTCWIPSEAGKEFQICYQDNVRTKTTRSVVKVDGNRCPGKIMHSRRSKHEGRCTAVHRGITMSEDTLRPYIFSDCRLVGTSATEDESDQLLGDLSALGEIKIRIDEVRVGSKQMRGKDATLPELQIHEKAKKGVVHGTQLGNAISRPVKLARQTELLRTLVTFVFRYRPMAVLMADGVAPQVTPVKRKHAASSSKSIDVIDLTLDDDLDSSPTKQTRRNPKRVRREVKQERSVTIDDSMPNINNFSAWVQVDGQPLPEYQIAFSVSEVGTQATCWIPSESGKEFQICYKDAARTISTGTKVSVDGVRCTAKISRAKHLTDKSNGTIVHRGMTISENSVRPFIFSVCHLVEDEADLLRVNLSALGEIKIEVSEVDVGPPTHRRIQSKLPKLSVHERTHKGITHGTQLGNEIVTRINKLPRKTTSLRPLVSFVFKYRPIDILIADGVAPPAARNRQSALGSAVEFIDLTLDDEENGGNGKEKRNLKTIKMEVVRDKSMKVQNIIQVIDLTV
ncbi:hypothetical protein CVT25_007274 [Psilocybe cyanescens]|uniref:DUF7918 domain-containing protein n=1 Tax=Psilocybe cyanescens TaxID=93625 RepID=A0A409XP78_PSICY|nr:hypothetical protein CVT25_007274 [Psilocybe cyanescens]